MSRQSRLDLIAVSGTAALYRDQLRTALEQTYANVRALDLPNISLVAGLDPATVFRGG
jgi:hypothetical protein